MTIGAPDYSGCRTEDFETLKRCREEATGSLAIPNTMGATSASRQLLPLAWTSKRWSSPWA